MANVSDMFFTHDQVMRLTSVSKQKLARWLKPSRTSPAVYAPERGAETALFTFRDLISLRVLTELRQRHRVKLEELRETGAKLAKQSKLPWAELVLYSLNGKVYFVEKGRIQEVLSGQLTFDPPIFIERVSSQLRREVLASRRRPKETIGKVDRDPKVQDGALCIAGTGVPVAAILSFHDAGYTIDAIRAQYPELRREDIRKALGHVAA